jgi:hypothetical protein
MTEHVTEEQVEELLTSAQLALIWVEDGDAYTRLKTALAGVGVDVTDADQARTRVTFKRPQEVEALPDLLDAAKRAIAWNDDFGGRNALVAALRKAGIPLDD